MSGLTATQLVSDSATLVLPGDAAWRRHRVHRPAMVFLTGLSGAGKSTLAVALEQRLANSGVLASVLDGDSLRAGLNRNLGFSREDRRENVRRAGELALHLTGVGVLPIVALIAPFAADRETVAQRSHDTGVAFAEVFVNAPLAICERRDPKQLYRKARAGELASFTGIDSPYEAPRSPALELRTDLESVAQSVEKLYRFTLRLVGVEADATGAAPANI